MLLQSKNKVNETSIGALKIVYENDINFSELIVQIDKLRHFVQSSGTTFEHNANARHVLQYLTKCY